MSTRAPAKFGVHTMCSVHLSEARRNDAGDYQPFIGVALKMLSPVSLLLQYSLCAKLHPPNYSSVRNSST